MIGTNGKRFDIPSRSEGLLVQTMATTTPITHPRNKLNILSALEHIISTTTYRKNASLNFNVIWTNIQFYLNIVNISIKSILLYCVVEQSSDGRLDFCYAPGQLNRTRVALVWFRYLPTCSILNTKAHQKKQKYWYHGPTIPSIHDSISATSILARTHKSCDYWQVDVVPDI